MICPIFEIVSYEKNQLSTYQMPGFGTFFESSLVLSFQVCHSLVVHLAFFKVFWTHYSYQQSGNFFFFGFALATTAAGLLVM